MSPAPASSLVPVVSLCPAAKSHPGQAVVWALVQINEANTKARSRAVKLGVKATMGVTQELAGGCHAPTGAGKRKAGSRQPLPAAAHPTHRNPAAEDRKMAFLSQNRRGGEAGALLRPTNPQRHGLSPRHEREGLV